MFTIGHVTSLSFLSSPFFQLVLHFLSSFCLLVIFLAICLSSQFLFCEGFELLIGSMYCCSNCGGFELLIGSRCCCFNCCSTKVLHLLLFNLFFFAMLSPLKFVLLGILIQVFLQVWECLIMCYEIESNATFLFPNQIPKDKVTLQTMLNSLMLHQYKLISTFDLLFEKDLGDRVKARSTTWYSQFLMSQYSDPRWIEHFKVSKEFVFQLTMKLKHLMEKKDMHYMCVVHARICVTCSLYKLAHGAYFF